MNGRMLSICLTLQAPAPSHASAPSHAPAPAPAPAPNPAPAPAPAPALIDALPPAPSLAPAQIDLILAGLPGPSLAEVQAAALDQSGVTRLSRTRWLQRARSAASLPTLSAQYDHRLDQGWALDSEVGRPDALRNDSGSQGVIRVKATWELDRLIFTPDELRVARTMLDLGDLRERVIIEVTTLYFERQRILLERELGLTKEMDAMVDAALHLLEIEGVLAGLTGLSFGPQVLGPSPEG